MRRPPACHDGGGTGPPLQSCSAEFHSALCQCQACSNGCVESSLLGRHRRTPVPTRQKRPAAVSSPSAASRPGTGRSLSIRIGSARSGGNRYRSFREWKTCQGNVRRWCDGGRDDERIRNAVNGGGLCGHLSNTNEQRIHRFSTRPSCSELAVTSVFDGGFEGRVPRARVQEGATIRSTDRNSFLERGEERRRCLLEEGRIGISWKGSHVSPRRCRQSHSVPRTSRSSVNSSQRFQSGIRSAAASAIG